MSLFTDALSQIDRGRSGLNRGIPMGFNRLVDYIPNLQQGMYYLLGGLTGSGKTTCVDSCFVFNTFNYINSTETDIKLKVIYYSLEISKAVKITKAICLQIYKQFGQTYDINYVLSRGKHRINDEVYQKVLQTKDYFDSLEDVITVIDKPVTPSQILGYLERYARENGKLTENELGQVYIPNNPHLYTIVVIDHIGLIKREYGFAKKDTLDKLSGSMIRIRNLFNFTPVLISQFNRDQSSTGRANINRIEPQLSDFKDTGCTQEDADIVLALFNPHTYEIKEYRGYDISRLKDRFRLLSILKNRYGIADISAGLHFNGAVGHFDELPHVQDFNNNPSLYDKYCR